MFAPVYRSPAKRSRLPSQPSSVDTAIVAKSAPDGHTSYYDRPAYRIEQALDGWKKVWAFFEKHLGK